MGTTLPNRLLVIFWVLAGTLLFATGCSETSPQSSVDDGWTLERDADEADAGPGDTSVDCRDRRGSACRNHDECTWYNPCSDDPGEGRCYRAGHTPGPVDCVPDANCRDIGSKRQCHEASLCAWASRSCADGSTTARCVGPGAAPPTLECPNSCSELETAEACRAQGDCGWTSKTCSDGTTVGACGGPLDGRPKLECPKAKTCADRAPDRCGDGNCHVYAPGCGGDNPRAFDGPTCLPEGTCDSDAECASGMSCVTLAIEPDCDRCGACAVGQNKCVPESWVPSTGEQACRELGAEKCRETDRCRMAWPSSCNDEAPSGAKTYDQATCLPAQRCDGGSSCSDGYTCQRLWTGCGPDAFCGNCGSVEQRCLREEP